MGRTEKINFWKGEKELHQEMMSIACTNNLESNSYNKLLLYLWNCVFHENLTSTSSAPTRMYKLAFYLDPYSVDSRGSLEVGALNPGRNIPV